MGKSLARLTETEINKVFELLGIERKNGSNSFYSVLERHFGSSAFNVGDMSLSGKILSDNNLCDGIILMDNWGDELKINSDCVFTQKSFSDDWKRIENKAFSYLVDQGYDLAHPTFI